MPSRSPVRNPETLAVLGQQLRRTREAAGLPQSQVKRMRQGTVSKVENGLDVTLDTFLTHVASLGLEVALLPLGQAALAHMQPRLHNRHASPQQPAPTDLLTEFDYLRDF